MRIPNTPPDTSAILNKLVNEGHERLVAVMRHSSQLDQKGRYLHWDDLRFRAPPGKLTVQEWWMVMRMARQAASQPIPLVDSSGSRFSFNETANFRSALRAFDMNAGGALATDVTALSTGEGKVYLRRSLAEEPFTSSLIEGAATSRDIAKKLIFEGRQPRTKDERMVLNNYFALEYVKSRLNDDLTLEMVLELHSKVTAGTLQPGEVAGALRTTNNIRVVDESSNEILYQPPPAAELPKRLAALIRFANVGSDAANSNWIHPLVKAFIIHFMLSYEHPFVDGNGRVARALFYWAALKSGYWLMEYISISSVIAESTIAYGKSFLHVETDAGDLTYFLLYHAKILTLALSRLEKYVVRKRAEVLEFERKLQDVSRRGAFNHRQASLLNELARNRIARMTIGEHAQQHSVSYLTARNDLETLFADGLLRKVKSGRTSLYYPVANLMRTVARAAA